MQHKKQVVLNVLTIAAMLLAVIGIAPVSASLPSSKSDVASSGLLQNAGDVAEGLSVKPTLKHAGEGGEGGEIEGDPNVRDDDFYSKRVAGDPSAHFTMFEAAQLREAAAEQLANTLKAQARQPKSPLAFGGAWTNVGPNPMVLVGRGDDTFDAMTGRIGALAVRSTAPYTLYVGGAQGGVWTMAAPYTGTFTPKTDQLSSLAIGAIALAPSNEDIVYVGTGEGALSGDSYFGSGVLKSIDAGGSFFKVSASGYFTNVSISKIVVDPHNPNLLYAGTLRGRGGTRRTSPPNASPFGVWKSTDGGVNWTMVLTVSTNATAFAGVTDMAMDPQNPNILFASSLGRGISKTVDGGATWTTAMNGLPTNANYGAEPSRFALALSRPSAAVSATLYTGFDWFDNSNVYHHSTVWKSTNEGGSWAETNTTVVGGYCNQTPTSSASQCFYDNVIAADPITPTIVFVIGLYNYNTGSGGVYRSMDGGATWVDIGFNLHPDYHAIAIRKDNTSVVFIGNDGGLWWSSTRGGRLNPGDPLNATQWTNLNGTVTNNPAPTGPVVTARTNIVLGQFTSIATNSSVPNRFYGGTQDNGTLRKSTGSSTWFDTSSGDGGQVLVDPTDARYVYGTYFSQPGFISVYRFTDGAGIYIRPDGTSAGTSNEFIDGGINVNDRSEFYIPWIMDPSDPNRLYVGTFRVYRTDNAKTANSADVFWNAISGDLTSGCLGPAPNGGRGCVITAFGKSAGSPSLYVGNMEGWIWWTPDSTVANPTWTRVDTNGPLPGRPVADIAVDISNYRVAYAAYNGFSLATPAIPGHVFKTKNGGQTWTNVSNNLPDIPVNSIRLDPSTPGTLYVGTDIGPYVSTDDGTTWNPLGTGFPIVAIDQLAVNSFTRQLVAGTHGRGAWKLDDQATTLPALQISKSAPATPIGPGSTLEYTVKVQNFGNITATNVVITDPVPANTTFLAAGSGGTHVGNNVVWTVPHVAKPVQIVYDPLNALAVGLAPGETTVTFTVQITNTGVVTAGSVITNDGFMARSAEGPGAVGSPYYVTLAQAYANRVTPGTQKDATRAGHVITYEATINNLGFQNDSYNLSVSGNAWPTSVWNAGFTTLLANTGNVAGGGSIQVGVMITVPGTAVNGVKDTATLTAQSVSNGAVSASALITTTAITFRVLLVNNDTGAPNVAPYYQAALNANGQHANYWNLLADQNLTANMMKAHDVIVWETGASYPDPIGPYEDELAAFLNGGGRLFMSGQDILDQAAGTAPFVLNYLHINWDGTERQNDIGTSSVTGVVTNPVMSNIGTIPVDVGAVLGSDFSDEITPTVPAIPAFWDSHGKADALSVDTGGYKVIFLAFPLEAMGNNCDRADVVSRSLQWFLGGTATPVCAPISGPTTGHVNVNYSFSASVRPAIAATHPVGYAWFATGQTDVIHGDSATDSISYTWPTTGTKAIQLIVSNASPSGLVAALNGLNEVPPVTTNATGTAAFTFDPTTHMLHYELSTSGLISITASHIHTGTIGVSGPVAIPLNTPTIGYSSGTVGPLNVAQEVALFTGGYYVNVHTSAHPSGEIRGQIMPLGGMAFETYSIDISPYLIYLPIVRKSP